MLKSVFSKNFTNNWFKPDDINLTCLIKVGEEIQTKGYVTLDMTTNRTKKPGDDIFCTPAMIHKMNTFVLKKLNERLPPHRASVTSKVTCQHKAPLALGQHYNIRAKVASVSKDSAEFVVICDNDQKNIIGDAKIRVGIIGYD